MELEQRHRCSPSSPATMSPASFLVIKLPGTFIGPNVPVPVPSSRTLPLSPMDRSFPPRTFFKMMIVFKHGSVDAAKVVRQALCKALVAYYPLAGRLVRSECGKMEVACTGEGVWFVEARAECSLQDVDFLFELSPKISRQELLPYLPEQVGVPIMFQITQFSCDGFVLGLVFDHSVADGTGIAQFIVAAAEMARGLDTPTVVPIWSRDSIPGPPKHTLPELSHPSSPPPALFRVTCNKYFHIDISLDQIDRMKAEFRKHCSHRCTRFEIMAAITWQSKTRTSNLDRDVDINLIIPMNVRNRLLSQDHAAAGYYGNCVYRVMITTTCGKLIGARTSEVMQMIRDAKEGVHSQLSKWLKGEEDPAKLLSASNLLFVTDWTRLEFQEVDFGWGKPAYVTPITDNLPGIISFLVRSPCPFKGVRLIANCVLEENLAAFRAGILNAFESPSSLF